MYFFQFKLFFWEDRAWSGKKQCVTFQTFNLRIWWDFHFESCLKFGLRWPQWKLQWFCLYMISIYGPPCLHLLSYLNFSMSDMTIAEGKALHIITSCNFNETVFISTSDYAIYWSHYLWCLHQIMHCTMFIPPCISIEWYRVIFVTGVPPKNSKYRKFKLG